MAGLSDVLDPSTLPLAARIAQVVLAGTVIAHLAVLRPVNARADLILVAEMVHHDLSDDIRAGRLPALDPRAEKLERTLASTQRLSRKVLARNDWWSHASADRPSVLTTWQQTRLDGYQHQLDTAILSYRQAVQPWRGWWLAQTPRHFHGKQWGWISQRHPQPTKLEPNLVFEAGSAQPAASPPMTMLVPVPVPREAAPSITLAISRARGVDPAATGQQMEPAHASLDDVIGLR